MLISTFQRSCTAAIRNLLPCHDLRFLRKEEDPPAWRVFYSNSQCGLVYEQDFRDQLTSLYLTRLASGQIRYPFSEDLSGHPEAVNALNLFPIYGAFEVEAELRGESARESVRILTKHVGELLQHVLDGDMADFAEAGKVMRWRRSPEGMAFRMEQGKASLRSVPGIAKIIDPRLLEPAGVPELSTAELYRKLGIEIRSPRGDRRKRRTPGSGKKN